MAQVSRRSKRAKAAVDYAFLDSTGFLDCVHVQHKKLARAVFKFVDQPSFDNYSVDYVRSSELAGHVHSTGFRNPCVVRASPLPPSALGIRVPEGELTVERIADLVGRSRHVNTIDVATQSEGPIYTMQEWVDYFAAPSPRKQLLNVVSLDLANTSLQTMVSAPSLVKELDLVDKAWPASLSPSPKVQLYALMSVANCYMDFHIDFGGSSVWYHVLSGRKVFLVIPPIRGNLLAFEEWSSSDKQASVFFADRASGCQKLELGPGDTLLLWQMEERLKVRSKFRFPFFKELMWHTASMYLKLLKEDAGSDVCKVTKWERAGLQSLAKWLSFCVGQVKDGYDVPKEISQPGTLLVEDLLKYTKNQASSNGRSEPSAGMRTRIVVKPPSALQCSIPKVYVPESANKSLEDKDEQHDSDERGEDDEDYTLGDEESNIILKPGRKTRVNISGPKISSSSRTPSGSSGISTRSTKSDKNSRQRLLKKCGFDPRIPLPNPKTKRSADRDS